VTKLDASLFPLSMFEERLKHWNEVRADVGEDRIVIGDLHVSCTVFQEFLQDILQKITR
jgi:hypothetical protein